MQAIARVNRVYKDKEADLFVDYIGMAAELKNKKLILKGIARLTLIFVE